LVGIGIRPEHTRTPEAAHLAEVDRVAPASARERLGIDAERVARHALNRIGFGDFRSRSAPHASPFWIG
jgi:hypothetical protein